MGLQKCVESVPGLAFLRLRIFPRPRLVFPSTWGVQREQIFTKTTEATSIQKQSPQMIDSEVLKTKLGQISTPPLQGLVSNDMSEGDMQESCGAFAEWIAMVQLGSPRVSADDDVDSYLSRYVVPADNGSRTTDLISLKWHGLISGTWVLQLFISLLLVPYCRLKF